MPLGEGFQANILKLESSGTSNQPAELNSSEKHNVSSLLETYDYLL